MYTKQHMVFGKDSVIKSVNTHKLINTLKSSISRLSSRTRVHVAGPEVLKAHNKNVAGIRMCA
jgi:cell division protein FtsL